MILRRFAIAGTLTAACGLLAYQALSAEAFFAQGPPNAGQDRFQQGPPGGQQRGRRGPFGPMPFAEPVTALLLMPEVQQELSLKPEQVDVVRLLQRDWDEKSAETMENMGPPAGGDFSEMEAMFAQMQTKLDELNAQADDRLKETLSPEQHARLNQLRLQRGGPDVLVQDKVALELKLTDEQSEQILNLSAGGFGGFGSPRFVEDPKREALALLADAQKETWSKLVGAPFNFPQDEQGFGRGRQGRGGFGRGGFGPGGFGGQERKLVADFDKDSDGWLNSEERAAARESMNASGAGENAGGRGRGGNRGGFGGPGGFGGRGGQPGTPGPRLQPENVTPVSDAPLYEAGVLRTLFLEFENPEWEEELEAFHNTDVEVPATLIVDGNTYPNVGVHFRGMSSYGGVPRGSKRSMNVKLDFVDGDQNLYGYETLNLLNSHGDPSFLSSVLYSHIARQYIPAPQANLVKVVVNGESWGIYANVQQYDKVFIKENFKTKGTRWKVQGSPGGRGGLEYIGDNVEDYKRIYTMKSNDGDEAWTKLIELCRTLNETPADELEAALDPMMDIDEVLAFLALDVATVNSDGYWTRASDYYLFLGEDGKFRLIPHDMNEAFKSSGRGRPGAGRGGPDRGGQDRGGQDRGGQDRGGPDRGGQDRGGRGREGRGGNRAADGRGGRDGIQGRGDQRGGFGPPDGPPQDGGRQGRGRGGRGPGGFGGGGPDLDPLIGLDDSTKALRSQLLSVPSLRARYLEIVRNIAEVSMDWKNLGPVVEQYGELVGSEVEADTRKLTSYEEFVAMLSADSSEAAEPGQPAQSASSLKSFFDKRREYLLNYKDTSAGR